MNNIFYNITSASLSRNPFIHFLHTIHITTPPDIVTGWHILWQWPFSWTSTGSSTPLRPLETTRVKDYLLHPRQHSIDHMKNSAPFAYTHQSWQMEHYYILYFKSYNTLFHWSSFQSLWALAYLSLFTLFPFRKKMVSWLLHLPQTPFLIKLLFNVEGSTWHPDEALVSQRRNFSSDCESLAFQSFFWPGPLLIPQMSL